MNRLSTTRLTLAYDGAPIIRNLDLVIPAGQITALVGPNGKSTLPGFSSATQPRAGAVYLDGASIFKLSTKMVAKRLGILPQAGSTGRSHGSRSSSSGPPYQNWLQQWSKQDEQLVELAPVTTGMTGLADRALDTLSGGQRQRADCNGAGTGYGDSAVG